MKLRQSTLDRQDQLHSVINHSIPQAFQSLYDLDREFTVIAQQYEQNRQKALDYIKELNRFEDQLSKSLGVR